MPLIIPHPIRRLQPQIGSPREGRNLLRPHGAPPHGRGATCCARIVSRHLGGSTSSISKLYRKSLPIQAPLVPGPPRPNEDAALSIDGLEAALQLDHALNLLGERQVGKVATSLFLGVLLFRKRPHSCHVDSSLPGQTRPCAAQISANLFLSNRSDARKDCTRNLSFARPV